MALGERFPEVLEAARRGDDDAVAELVRALHPALIRFLRGADREAADDLAQETWLALARLLPGFEGDERAFVALAFTVARRRVLDHRRGARRRPAEAVPAEVLDALGPGDDPAEVVVQRLSAEGAAALVGSLLPREQAEVLLLRVVGGLDATEVAGIVGRSPGAVRVLQHRALRRLASVLGDRSRLDAWRAAARAQGAGRP